MPMSGRTLRQMDVVQTASPDTTHRHWRRPLGGNQTFAISRSDCSCVGPLHRQQPVGCGCVSEWSRTPVRVVVWRAMGQHQIRLPKEEYAECGPGREHDREADVVPRVGLDREGTEGADA